MNRSWTRCIATLFVIATTLMADLTAGAADKNGTGGTGYYKARPQFHMYPDEKAVKQTLKRLGPIGIGLELLQPAFTMRVMSVEKGSPADGKLNTGQYIESINGKVLKDDDPRVILGNLITEAEAKDGVIKMMVKDTVKGSVREVIVNIPTLGAYSDTWPINCKKSDTIVNNFADFLAKHPRGWGAALFLLSTGEEKDLDVVRGWFSGKLKGGKQGFPWSTGYGGPAICEYYLRTGDKSVLPAIEGMAESLKETIYNGGWAGRGGAPFRYMAGGHMNAAGVHCVTFLMLAKECGVKVDEYTLQSSLQHFYRYAGHWNVSYGDGVPEGGGVDNGKNGGLAFAMAAAASLTPEGEKSVYAKARDVSANKSFYTTSWLFHGHTGGGIGELWRGAAMGLLAQKRPGPYQSFMNERRWMYELARTHDGAFGWSSVWNVSYDTTGHNGGKSWGNYVPLIYTVPRQKLRIFGAPRTKFSKPYQLPKRPWGTAADETFCSIEPGQYRPGQRYDMEAERLPTHASWPIMLRLDDEEISDDDLLAFAHHPDSSSRGSAAGRINSHGRTHLIVELLRSKDPRGRLSGLYATMGKRKGKYTPVEMTDEIIELVGGMITDREESWWVAMAALETLGLAPAEKIAPYSERIVYWLKHEDWWLRQAALKAATPIVIDKRFSKSLLPIVGSMIAENERAAALGPVWGMVGKLKEADPEVQQYATEIFAAAYRAFPKKLVAPGGQDMSDGVNVLAENIATHLSNVPGGFDALYKVSQERFPGQALPHQSLYMRADSNMFGPKVKGAFKPLVLNNLIPQFMADGNHTGSNRSYLMNEVTGAKPIVWNFYYREPRMAELVRLYNRIGVHEYDWKKFGPDLTEIKWMYHSFDPAEEKPWTPGTRYRTVTYPAGMENWFARDFDSEKAGWKGGLAPFGQLGGKLVAKNEVGRSVVELHGCKLGFCRCSDAMKTLWEKEVLLVQAKLKLPPFREGYRYRLCVGGMSHVNGGDGYRIYVNGKLMHERKRGVGKREGGRPECHYIDKAWWDDFKGEVTIAATGFLPIPGGKHSQGVKRQHFSVFLQQMKVPPLTDEMFARGRLLHPMRGAAWQATKEASDLYRYDGSFVESPKAVGKWTQLGKVASIDSFDPAAEMTPDPQSSLQQITLEAEGVTDHEDFAWSDGVLMNLKDRVALAMTPKTIKGADYLFIEAGGFSVKNGKSYQPDHPADWKPMQYVMKKQ